MWQDDGCSPSRRTNKVTSLRQRTDVYWEVSRINRRNISRPIPLLPQDPDFGWVVKWQPARVGTSFALISRQLSFKDSLMVWIVILCANCHQKQVILLTLLQDWWNLLTAWMMLLDAGGRFWTKHFVVMAWFLRELIDAVTCCTQYSRVSEVGNRITLHSGAIPATF